MSIIIKLVIGIITILILTAICYYLLTALGLNLGAYFTDSQTKKSNAPETKVIDNETFTSPDIQFDQAKAIPQYDKTLLEQQLKDAILNAKNPSNIQVNGLLLSETCPGEVVTYGKFRPFPGYAYDRIEAHLEGPPYPNNSVNSDFELRFEGFYPERQPAKYTPQYEESDSFTFSFKIENDSCELIPDESTEANNYRSLIPPAENQKAIEISKKNKLVSDRLKEREYKIETYTWEDTNDIKNDVKKYGQDPIRDILLSFNPQALILLNFDHRLSPCESFHFMVYVDTLSEQLYVGKLSQGFNGECAFMD